jgi:hypothetical protein
MPIYQMCYFDSAWLAFDPDQARARRHVKSISQLITGLWPRYVAVEVHIGDSFFREFVQRVLTHSSRVYSCLYRYNPQNIVEFSLESS